MIIIGILAAIAIPVFLSQRGQARDSSTKADVTTVGKEMATYYVDNEGLPPTVSVVSSSLMLGADRVGNASMGTAVSSQTGVNNATWCVSMTNPSGTTQTYQFSAQGGLAPGAC